MSPINERQWQGLILIWLTDLLRLNGLPFSKVEQEVEVTIGDEPRRFPDLTLCDKHRKRVCVFELKLPDRADGRSPRHLPVVIETQRKADGKGLKNHQLLNATADPRRFDKQPAGVNKNCQEKGGKKYGGFYLVE